MIPLLSSTGELAFEVGLNNSGKIKLPIFRLPAIERASISAQNVRRNDNASRGSVDNSGMRFRIEFIPYNSRGTLKNALLVMMHSMSIRSKEMSKRYLSMSEADFSDFELVMETQEPARKTPIAGREEQQSSKLSVLDLFLFDEDVSLFINIGDMIHRIKLGARIDNISSGITSLYSFADFKQRSQSLSPGNEMGSFSNETLKKTQTFQLSSLSTLGFSSELAEFVADHQHLDTIPRPSKTTDFSTSNLKPQSTLRHIASHGSKRNTKKGKTALSASFELARPGGQALTSELAASLKRMQDHTSHVSSRSFFFLYQKHHEF
jgi:hypothetical protein